MLSLLAKINKRIKEAVHWINNKFPDNRDIIKEVIIRFSVGLALLLIQYYVL